MIADDELKSHMEITLENAKKKNVDFALVRGEKSFSQLVRAEKETIRNVNTEESVGIGVEVVVSGAKGYGFSTDFDKESLKEIVEKAIDGAKSAGRLAKEKMEPLEIEHKKYQGETPEIKNHPRDAELEEKTELLMAGVNAILEKDVKSLTSFYGEEWGKRFVFTSEGLERSWKLIKTGLLYRPVVKRNGQMGNATEQSVASMGLSLFKQKGKQPRETAKKALKGARDMAEAKAIDPGRYSLVTDPRFGGVMAHESFGHLTEADGIITGESILTGRKGEKLGSEKATIIESGDPQNYGFYVPYDDEGTSTKKTYLLKNGVLKNFLHSRFTAKTLDSKVTGNARGLNFRYPSIVRMRNTFFAPGEHEKEELFELIDEGIYVVGSRGGQTEPTGTFTFSADRAYWIEGGEKKYPLKGAVVRGNILNFLKNIIGASKELEVTTSVRGGCGKSGQGPLPVGNGGPHLAVEEAIVGGGK